MTRWDFSDPAFIPHGGLVDRELRPKEGYRRLKALIESWRRSAKRGRDGFNNNGGPAT